VAGLEQLEQYADQARECRAAAEHAKTPEERERLRQMANRWEELARQRAAQMNLEHVLADLLNDRNYKGGTSRP
jgi:hypothetical protein